MIAGTNTGPGRTTALDAYAEKAGRTLGELHNTVETAVRTIAEDPTLLTAAIGVAGSYYGYFVGRTDGQFAERLGLGMSIRPDKMMKIRLSQASAIVGLVGRFFVR